MTSSTHRSGRFLVRARNFLLWALLSVAVFLALFKIGSVVEDRWGHDAFIRWCGLGGFTIILFWFFVGKSEKFLRRRQFWVVTAVLLTAHLAAFAIVLALAKEWKLMWFMVMVFELPPMLFFRDRFVNPY